MMTLTETVAVEQSADFYLACAKLATTMRQKAAEREANEEADNLRVLEHALWVAYVERRAREEVQP